MSEPKENKMGTMPENKLLVTMALPIMISMLVQALYNIVDSIFVARICEDALTAVSMAFPMQNMMIAVSAGLGIGTNALLSRNLGQKKPEEASRYAINGIFLAFLSYILFFIVGILAVRIFYQSQGASPAITEYGVTYLTIVLCCSIGLFMQIIFERLLQATGKTLITMFTQTTGAVLNMILDPILIFGLFGAPKLGIAGAAVATVTGQIVAAIIAIICNLKFNHEIHLSFIKYRPSAEKISQILVIGIPSVFMIGIGSVMTFCMNKILVVFSSTAVAVFGVYFKLQSFAFMPIIGMNNGMIPIIAYNYGAKKPDRMMKTLKLAGFYAELIMFLCLIFGNIFASQLFALFNASETMLSIGIPAFRIISIHFIFAGICVISGAFFQALGQSMYSLIISVVRQLVFLVPVAYLLAQTGNLSLVWWAWPIAELASLTLSLLFLRRVYRKMVKPMF